MATFSVFVSLYPILFDSDMPGTQRRHISKHSTIERSAVYHIHRIKDITIVIINIQMAIVLSQVSFSIEHFGLNILNNRNEFQNTENHIASCWTNSEKCSLNTKPSTLIFYPLSSLHCVDEHNSYTFYKTTILQMKSTQQNTNERRFRCVTTSHKHKRRAYI